jgi:hypothetical protein
VLTAGSVSAPSFVHVTDQMADSKAPIEPESVKSRRVALSGLTAARIATGLLPELNAIIAEYATAKGTGTATGPELQRPSF